MPIYAYKCSSCGHAQDVLQKISDPLLTVCTACGKETFVKQLTAPGFQLKGSGWYATDFKGGAKPVAEGESKPAGDAKAAGTTDGAAPTAAKSEAGAAGKSDAKAETKAETKPAPSKPAASNGGTPSA